MQLYLSISHKEELFRGVLCQARKPGFNSLLSYRVPVGPVRLVKSAVVCNVLTLGQDSVQLEHDKNTKM